MEGISAEREAKEHMARRNTFLGQGKSVVYMTDP